MIDMNKKTVYEQIYKKILSCDVLKENKVEALIYGLQEIGKSIEIIYQEILPKMLNEDPDKEKILNLLWDIREEFRHIDYHIKDAEILDL